MFSLFLGFLWVILLPAKGPKTCTCGRLVASNGEGYAALQLIVILPRGSSIFTLGGEPHYPGSRGSAPGKQIDYVMLCNPLAEEAPTEAKPSTFDTTLAIFQTGYLEVPCDVN